MEAVCYLARDPHKTKHQLPKCDPQNSHRDTMERRAALLCCDLRDKFFASLCFRDVLREMVLSLSNSSESIKTSNRSLLNLRCLSEGRKHVPQVQFFNACRPVVALYFGSDLAHLEVLRVPHAADHVLRLLAEWVDRLILFQVGFQRFATWMRFKLMNQLFGCFLAGVVLLLDS